MRGRKKGELPSRERFLIAMDEIFVEAGYAGASIRRIAERAGTGLAVVNRNWDNKEALLREALSRHFDAIHARQMAAYDKLEQLAREGSRYTAAQVLLAFFEPAFSDLHAREGFDESVYCCALVERSDEARAIVLELVMPVARRTLELLRAACPATDEGRFLLVSTLTLSAYSYPLAFRTQLMTVLGTTRAEFDRAVTAQSLALSLAGLFEQT